ncbi:hypothetical protein [uncultured Croceitalea sp.]|uniref:hypothetical protein n=1 Tax=uncultured Croceitalea sp. TaxID=1798908 RepID=UPI0033059B86
MTDSSSGFGHFLSEFSLKKFFPEAGRHFGLPVIATILHHVILLLEAIDKFTKIDIWEVDYFKLVVLSNAFLCTCFIIARPPNGLSTKEVLKKFPNIHRRFQISRKKDFEEYSDRSIQSIDKMISWWTLTCGIWLLYYVFQAFSLWNGQIRPVWMDIIFEVFNYASTFTLFACYHILAFSSFNKNGNFNIQRPLLLVGIWFSVFLFLDCSFKYGFLDSLNSSSSEDVNSLYWIASSVGGFISAAFFSMLISRFDSKIMHVPAFFIFILFGYAAIQSFYPLLSFIAQYDTNEGKHFFNSTVIIFFRNFIILLSLWGKLILFLLIFWMCRNHRLYMYFIRMNDISKKYPNSRVELYRELESLD